LLNYLYAVNRLHMSRPLPTYGPEVPPELQDKARTHVPKVDVQPDKVRKGESALVKIDLSAHPDRQDHAITLIELYYEEEGRNLNPVHVAHIVLEPEVVERVVELRLRPRASGWLHVVAYCNQHGLWHAVKRIEVEG